MAGLWFCLCQFPGNLVKDKSTLRAQNWFNLLGIDINKQYVMLIWRLQYNRNYHPTICKQGFNSLLIHSNLPSTNGCPTTTLLLTLVILDNVTALTVISYCMAGSSPVNSISLSWPSTTSESGSEIDNIVFNDY